VEPDLMVRRRYTRDENWVIDPDARTITVARHGALDSVHRDSMTWQPAGAPAPLAFDIGAVFVL
jgi:hypothetical protein